MSARFLFTWYAVVRRGTQLRAFLEYMAKHSSNFGRAPDPSGDRGYTLLMVPWGDGGVCRLLFDVHQALSLSPCAVTVQRAPSHNRWGVSETTLPLRRHKGGRWTVRLISRHHVLQGGF